MPELISAGGPEPLPGVVVVAVGGRETSPSALLLMPKISKILQWSLVLEDPDPSAVPDRLDGEALGGSW